MTNHKLTDIEERTRQWEETIKILKGFDFVPELVRINDDRYTVLEYWVRPSRTLLLKVEGIDSKPYSGARKIHTFVGYKDPKYKSRDAFYTYFNIPDDPNQVKKLLGRIDYYVGKGTFKKK